MRISLQNGTVHKCSRISFVCVAADILLIRLICRRELPLQAGGETGAASASQTAVQQDLDHIFRLFLCQHNAKSLVATGSYVFFNIFRVDHTAVSQSNPVLFFIKIRLIERSNFVCFCCLFIEQAGHNSSFQKMFRHDLRNVILLYHGIKSTFRIYNHNRSQSAQAETAGLYHADFLGKPLGRNLFFQSVNNSLASGGGTSCSAADKYM